MPLVASLVPLLVACLVPLLVAPLVASASFIARGKPEFLIVHRADHLAELYRAAGH